MKQFSGMLIYCCVIAALIGVAHSAGKLDYGDKCSVQTAIVGFFANDVSDAEKCNIEKGLLCTGTCTCVPTRVWEQGPLFGIFGGGSCIVAANGPCRNGDRCVPNAKCGDTVPICLCQDGYYAHEQHCISNSKFRLLSSGASSQVVITALPLIVSVIPILKYFS